MKLRVLLVVPVISPRYGGGNAERTIQLAKAFSEAECNVSIISNDIGIKNKTDVKLLNVNFLLLPCVNQRFQIPFPQINKISRTIKNVDVVHVIGHWSILGVLVCYLCRLYGVPYIISPAGALLPRGRSINLKRLFNTVIGGYLIKNASLCVAITKKEVQDFEHFGISNSKVEIIPNGVSLQLPCINKSEGFNTKFNFPKTPYILFMGRINMIKGPDILLQAFKKISNKFQDINLVFSGPDEGMKGSLIKISHQLGLDDRVYFTGYISGCDKELAYSNAELLVVPSRSEAMSLVAVEAGLHAIPVIMTDQCGLEDIGEIDAKLVVSASSDDIACSLDYMLSDPEKIKVYGLRWREMVLSRFLWKNIAKDFLEILSEIARSSKN